MKKLLWIGGVLVAVVVAFPYAKQYAAVHLQSLMRGAVADALREPGQELVHAVVQQTLRDHDRNITEQMRHKAVQEAADFAFAKMPQTPAFPTKFALLSHSVESVPPDLKDKLYCEFGVYMGATINHIASRTVQTIHGFDSFEGLPENWRTGFPKGTFDMKGLPVVAANVKLYKGWFNESLPVWAQEHPGPIAFLHMDADLYSSTKTVFDLLGDRIVPGTVIQFDEYFAYPGWQEGEYKAFHEMVQARQLEFEYLGYCFHDQQVAVRITKVGASAQP